MNVDMVLVKMSMWEGEKQWLQVEQNLFLKQLHDRFTFKISGSILGLKCILNTYLSN